MTDRMNNSNWLFRTGPSRPLTAAALALLLLGGPACSMDDMVSAAGNDLPNQATDQDSELRDAEQALANHRVDEARQLYAEYLERHPRHGGASAGLALTNLMLLVELDEVGELLTEHLGAAHRIDANQTLYAEGGYLYWASRGARWQDDGDYRGIASLLEDELPWSQERLRSLTKFVEGLDEPTQKAIRQLVWVANALPSIDQSLADAIDDPNFQRIYIPGEVFHSSDLSLQLGRSELSLIRSIVAMARGLIYFIAAYEHEWTLETAFGQWRYDPDITHPYYEPGYEPLDYSVAYLDDHLFRKVANPDRLNAASGAFKKALEHGRDAVSFGVEERSSTTLRWDYIDEEDARDLDDFLAALRRAFDEPSEIPHTVPSVTVDLRPLFEEGRVLAEDIPWFERAPQLASMGEDDDPLEGLDRWSINDEARQAFWLDGVASPIPSDHQWTLDFGPDANPDNFVEILFGHYRERIDDVYNTTR